MLKGSKKEEQITGQLSPFSNFLLHFSQIEKILAEKSFQKKSFRKRARDDCGIFKVSKLGLSSSFWTWSDMETFFQLSLSFLPLSLENYFKKDERQKKMWYIFSDKEKKKRILNQLEIEFKRCDERGKSEVMKRCKTVVMLMKESLGLITP